MENKTHLFVDNYGELLAQVNGLELVSFEEDGGYQGEYCAVLSDDNRLFYYVDGYGSCSGCDWLEDNGDWYKMGDELGEALKESGKRYAVPYKDAVEYCAGTSFRPKYVVPKSVPLRVVNQGEYRGFELVPGASIASTEGAPSPTTKKRKKVVKWTWKDISRAIEKAYESASRDSWGVPYLYQPSLRRLLRKSLPTPSPRK